MVYRHNGILEDTTNRILEVWPNVVCYAALDEDTGQLVKVMVNKKKWNAKAYKILNEAIDQYNWLDQPALDDESKAGYN